MVFAYTSPIHFYTLQVKNALLTPWSLKTNKATNKYLKTKIKLVKLDVPF